MARLLTFIIFTVLISSAFAVGVAAQQEETGFAKLISTLWEKIKTVITGQATINEKVPDVSIQALSGSGTVGDPYLITNCTDLNQTRDNLAAYYQLTQSINCSDTINWNSGLGFEPIGNVTIKFTGSFDGQNHTITGLYINRPSTGGVGLFGWVGSSASISNVGLEDVDITGSWYAGGLVGNNNNGTITNSYATGSVSGSSISVGGLVGRNWFGTITNSFSTGSVSGNIEIGGLVGTNFGTITNSYSTGTVSGSGNRVGGLVGYNGGTITNSYATGNVSGSSSVGGLVGFNGGTITNSFCFDRGISCGGGTTKTPESYFYNVSNSPLSSWSYPPWSTQNDLTDYPILEWQEAEAPPNIIYTEFDGLGDTTNFSAISDFSNIINLTLHNPEYGKIAWQESINLSGGADLDAYVNISFNRIDVNSSALPALNMSAIIQLFNLTFSNPQILIDGELCPSTQCIELSFTGGTLTFNVTHFTVYSARETLSAPAAEAVAEEVDEGIGCPPQFECGEWDECNISGMQERVCEDTLCTFPYRIETQDCVYVAPAPEIVEESKDVLIEETGFGKALKWSEQNANYLAAGLVLIAFAVYIIKSFLRKK